MDAKKPAQGGQRKIAMITTTGTATVKVIARPKNQCIDVSIDRGNWWKGFQIKIVDGVLPERYRGDPQIEAAYRLVLAQHCKWQNMESERRAKEANERESIDSAYNDIFDAEFEVIAPDGQRWKIGASGTCEGFPPGSVIVNGLLSPINRLIGEVIASGGGCATK